MSSRGGNKRAGPENDIRRQPFAILVVYPGMNQDRNPAQCACAAFSLLELLIVLAVVAILAALLFSAVSGAKRSAQKTKCVANLHQIGAALQNFVTDNHAYPSIQAGTNSENPGSWFGQLERGGFGATTTRSNFWREGVWRCPSWNATGTSRWARLSYGYNAYGITATSTIPLGLRGPFVSASTLFAPISESEVVNPGEMMAVGEEKGGVFFTRRGWVGSRHQGKVNVTFCDGHVESPTRRFLSEDTSDEALVRWNRDHQPHREAL